MSTYNQYQNREYTALYAKAKRTKPSHYALYEGNNIRMHRPVELYSHLKAEKNKLIQLGINKNILSIKPYQPNKR